MSTPTTSQPKLKCASHPPPASSSPVSTSYGNNSTQSRKRQKRLKTRTVPTENHLILRRLTDEYDEWEEGLTEGKEKLYSSEVSQCVGIIMKYAKSKSFPKSDDDYPRHLVDRSREGWVLFRALDEFLEKHPECSDQCKRNGAWFFTESCL